MDITATEATREDDKKRVTRFDIFGEEGQKLGQVKVTEEYGSWLYETYDNEGTKLGHYNNPDGPPDDDKATTAWKASNAER